MTHDHRTYLLWVLVRENRKKGLSFTAAIGEAIKAIENGGFDWRAHFSATVNDERILARDHIVPLSKGGAPLARNNLQTTHARCNLQKGSRTI